MSSQPLPQSTPGANVVQGIAPPHSIEAEQSVLGAVLLSEKTHYAYVIEEGLRPEDFYRDRHRVIYESMLELYNESEPIDVLTVTEHLRARGKLEEAGGPAEIDGLSAAVPAVGNLRRYGHIVRDHALLRRLLTTTYEIQSSVHNHEALPRDIVERAERSMLEVAHDDRQKDFRKVGDLLHGEIDKWQRLSAEGQSLTGTPSGFTDLDEITGGFQPGNLIIIAARPSMGKSALVTNMAENVALHRDHPQAVALFSLEMSEAELAQRFIASQASIRGDDLRKGRLKEERKWKRVLETAARYDAAPLYVDDSSDIGILEIRAKARRLHSQHPGGLGLVVVDYLQLLRPEGRVENRVEQVGQMSRGLKILARELNIPVIALSQLSRGVESRNDKRPLLSDLRESGQIEQDADLVMFIYRDEYYNDNTDRPGEADLLIAKHRNGGLGDVPLTFQGEYPGSSAFSARHEALRGPHQPTAVPAGGCDVSTCPFGECDGTGFLVDEATRVARPCRCRAQVVERRRARALSAVIPRKYKGVSFDRPPVTEMPAPVTRSVHRFVRDLDANLGAGRGLWFFGSVGTGKTTLAMLVSKAALDAGRSVAIYSLPRLLAEIRTTFDDSSDRTYTTLLDRLATVDLLHVDDVGAEKTSPWVLEQLYAIVNARYEAERSIVITTNLERDELADQITERTASRLEEMCELLPLWGSDARQFRPDRQTA